MPGDLATLLSTALRDSGADWADVALLACGPTPGAQVQALLRALRSVPFQGRVYFMRADATLAHDPQPDLRTGSVAGMLAARALSRLIGETTVLAVDVGAAEVRCSLIRGGELPRVGQAVDLVELGPPLLTALRKHCERLGQDPRECTLLAFGGGGAAHAIELAVGLGCVRAVLPTHPAAFSAWGLLQAEVRFRLAGTLAHGDDIATAFYRLRAQALRHASAHGLAEDDLRFEMVQDAGHCSLTVTAAVTKSSLPIRPSTDRWPAGAGPVHGEIDGDQLEPGMCVQGPAVLNGAAKALQLPAQTVLTVDSYGNFIVEFAGHGRGSCPDTTVSAACPAGLAEKRA